MVKSPVITILLANVLFPAIVCTPVVTTPEFNSVAIGIAAKGISGDVPVNLPVGPSDVPGVQVNVVGYLSVVT